MEFWMRQRDLQIWLQTNGTSSLSVRSESKKDLDLDEGLKLESMATKL